MKLKNYLLAVLLSFAGIVSVQAQCPPAAFCTPGNPSNPNYTVFNAGFATVRIGTRTFTYTGARMGYTDRSCADSLSLIVGVNYQVTIQTGTTVNSPNEQVKAWLDLDNNGTFDPATEEVFNSSTGRTHIGSFSLPSSVLSLGYIRLRISSDVISANQPTPCSTPTVGQVVDLGIRGVANLAKPVAKFGVSDSLICSGAVQFTDQSSNAPTSWDWDFGDGFTSTAQSPSHTYASPDTFTVRLIARNANGSDTIVKPNFIVYNDSVPVAAQCIPVTIAPCCGYSIKTLKFAGINTVNNTLIQGSNDLSCRYRSMVLAGNTYAFSFEGSASSNQDTKVYIDWNADGDFNDTLEEALSLINRQVHNGSITVPEFAIRNRPIRMRVMTDAVGSTLSPCNNLTSGASQDFTLMARENVFPPVSSFTADTGGFCKATINFTYTGENPVTQLIWNFGDGTIDTVASRTISHTYLTRDTFTVSVKAINIYGSDSVTYPNFVYYLGAPKTAACSFNSQNAFNGVGIFNVNFGGIRNTSGDAREGNLDLTCRFVTSVRMGDNVPISVTISNNTPVLRVWIDWNNDATLDATNELVFSGGTNGVANYNGTVRVPTNAVHSTPLRMRVAMDFSGGGPGGGTLNPCGQIRFGQYEDYSVVVEPVFAAPIAGFRTNTLNTCYGSITFTDTSRYTPTKWHWNFGDGDTSNLSNPVHNYTRPGTYTVVLKVSNDYGRDSVTRLAYITITDGEGIKRASCTPPTNTTNNNFGIRSIVIGSINATGLPTNQYYQDYACSRSFSAKRHVRIPVTVTMASNNFNERLAIFIDINNDGILDTSERVLSTTGTGTIRGNIILPANTVLGTRLRMRLRSEPVAGGPGGGTNNAAFPCQTATNGSTTIDLGVKAEQNTDPPIAGFRTDKTETCTGIIAFTDTSINEVLNYRWFFGNGDSSNLRNPVYRYRQPGAFVATLIVSNSFGSDTAEQIIAVADTNGASDPICRPNTQNRSPNFTTGIYRVQFNTINDVSGAANVEGYQDKACGVRTEVREGDTHQLTVTTNPSQNETVVVWIDYNADNQFTQNEEVLRSANTLMTHTASITIPLDAVLDKTLRMRVLDEWGNGNIALACQNLNLGQAEDFGVIVRLGVKTKQNFSKLNFSLVPNPAKDILKVVCSEELNQVRILSLTGKELMVRSQAENLDISQLKAGMYLVEISSAKGTSTQRLVKE